MHVEWYGQSAFRLTDDAVTVFIDPFDDLTALAERGVRWEYPAIEGVEADLLLVTHEHLDHNGDGPIGGEPVTLLSTASPTSAIWARASCARSRRRRWAGSTSSSSPSAMARPSAPSRPPRSPLGSEPR